MGGGVVRAVYAVPDLWDREVPVFVTGILPTCSQGAPCSNAPTLHCDSQLGSCRDDVPAEQRYGGTLTVGSLTLPFKLPADQLEQAHALASDPTLNAQQGNEGMPMWLCCV